MKKKINGMNNGVVVDDGALEDGAQEDALVEDALEAGDLEAEVIEEEVIVQSDNDEYGQVEPDMLVCVLFFGASQ